MPKLTADQFFAKAKVWRPELRCLRELCLDSGLREEIKWASPCYTHDGRNVVGIAAFNSYFGLWFFQGALLNDAASVLTNAQQGKTRAMRQWRMSSAKDIRVTLIRRYLKAARQLAEQGREIKALRNAPLSVPQALQDALHGNRSARLAFDALRPGLRREYAEFVAAAKRPETVARRIAKMLPMIEKGTGLNDRYRQTCGR